MGDGIEHEKKRSAASQQSSDEQTRHGDEEDDDSEGLAGSRRPRTVDQNTSAGHGRRYKEHAFNNVYRRDSGLAEKQKQKIRDSLDTLFVGHAAYADKNKVMRQMGGRAGGTCLWIKDHVFYKAWVDGTDPGLCISAGPGQGKTMLSLFIIEDLESRHQEHVVYFVCHPCLQGIRHNSATSALRSLLFQIIEQQEHLAHHIIGPFEGRRQSESTLASFDALWVLFERIVRDAAFQTTYCIIDGLHECDPESISALSNRIAYLMANLKDTGNTRLRMLVSTCDLPEILELKQLQFLSLNRDREANEQRSQDVKRIVEDRVKRLVQRRVIDPRSQADIQATLLRKSHGSLLWVSFSIKRLDKAKTQTEVARLIQEQPDGLSAHYSKMLNFIEPHFRAISASVLRFVILAGTSLTVRELSAFFPEHDRPACYDANDRLTAQHSWEQNIRDHVETCHNFLDIIDDRVQLIDQSAKDFFLSNDCSSEFHISAQEGHLAMATRCFEALEKIAGPDMNSIRDTSEEARQALLEEMHPLCSYASLYWHMHTREAGEPGAELIRFCKTALKDHRFIIGRLPNNPFSLSRFPQSGLIFSEGGETRSTKHNAKKESKSNASEQDSDDDAIVSKGSKTADCYSRDRRAVSVAHLAASLDLEFWLTTLLSKQEVFSEEPRIVSFSDENYFGETPLQTAVGWNAAATVGRLLGLGIGGGISRRNRFGEAPLHYASDVKIVRLLLNYKADVDIRTYDHSGLIGEQNNAGKTPLMAAAAQREEEMMKALLANGADVNAKDQFDRTPLLWAIDHQRDVKIKESSIVETIRLLLDHGANINASSQKNTTGLHIAAIADMQPTARFLLQSGANPEAKTREGLTPLHVTKSKEMARLLLSMGAAINAKNCEGLTPIQMPGSPLEFFLEAGADVNSIDANGNSVLAGEIIRQGHGWLDRVRALLRHGANAANINYRGTILPACHLVVLTQTVEDDFRQLIALLQQEGKLDVNARMDEMGATATHLAAANGNLMALKHLTGLGVGIDEQFDRGYTALHVAAAFLRGSCVTVLLDNGAHEDIFDSDGYHPAYHCVTLNSPIRKLFNGLLQFDEANQREKEWHIRLRISTIEAFGTTETKFGTNHLTHIPFRGFNGQNKATLSHYAAYQLLESTSRYDWRELGDIASSCLQFINNPHPLFSVVNNYLAIDIAEGRRASLTPFYLLMLAYIRGRFDSDHDFRLFDLVHPTLDVRLSDFISNDIVYEYTSALGIIFLDDNIGLHGLALWRRLLEHGAKADTVRITLTRSEPTSVVPLLHLICRNGSIDRSLSLALIGLLFRFGAKPDQRAEYTESDVQQSLALHHAVSPQKGYAHAEIVETLLKAKWKKTDEDTKRRELTTALIAAVDQSNTSVGSQRPAIVELLLSHGADVEGGGVEDAIVGNTTPLLIAVKSCQTTSQWRATKQVLGILVSRKANVNVTDGDTGESAVQYACKYKVYSAAKWLVGHGASTAKLRQSDLRKIGMANATVPNSKNSPVRSEEESRLENTASPTVFVFRSRPSALTGQRDELVKARRLLVPRTWLPSAQQTISNDASSKLGDGSSAKAQVTISSPSPHTLEFPRGLWSKKIKLPWRYKALQIALPRDEKRGQPGHAPETLSEPEVRERLRSWEQRGYNTRGFDLSDPGTHFQPGDYSQSRSVWPNWSDVARERAERHYRVYLPDFEATRRHVDMISRAKLLTPGRVSEDKISAIVAGGEKDGWETVSDDGYDGNVESEEDVPGRGGDND